MPLKLSTAIEGEGNNVNPSKILQRRLSNNTLVGDLKNKLQLTINNKDTIIDKKAEEDLPDLKKIAWV